MRLKINEIFYSLQGEGYYTGKPATFIRMSGCNLACPFCDTHHQPGSEMALADIVKAVSAFPSRHVVLTGGEPTLQSDLPLLVDALHEQGFYVQIETNGTLPVPDAVDWITCSPKLSDVTRTVVTHPHELKVVYQGAHQDMKPYETFFCPQVWSLQPCDTGDTLRNREIIAEAVAYVKAHPQWRLSLQTHKLIDIQ